MKSFLRYLPLAALLFAPSALADGQSESDGCLRTKIWADYKDGWAVRTAVDHKLMLGEKKIFLVTLYAGNQYKFQACGDNQSVDLDLNLHDATGKSQAWDDTESKDPGIEFTPTKTDTYYISVYLNKAVGDAGSHFSMAVQYK